MHRISLLGYILIMLGALLCFLNLYGLLSFLKLRNLKRNGIEGEAVCTLQEWISSGQRVYYDVKLPEGRPLASFIEVGVEPLRPVGTVVPVVYDPKRPRRAKTGTRADIDLFEERILVKLFWIPGLSCIGIGTLLALVF